MENESPLWAKLLRVGSVIALISAIAYGIYTLEEMRKRSAEEKQAVQEAGG